jgi:hypothetical protein
VETHRYSPGDYVVALPSWSLNPSNAPNFNVYLYLDRPATSAFA